MSVNILGLLVAHTRMYSQLVCTANTYQFNNSNPYSNSTSGNNSLEFSITTKMTAGDTAQVKILVSGGTKVVGIQGNSGTGGPLVTFWNGYLVA